MNKAEKIDAILTAMAEAYEAEGVEGDFADARRYYTEGAADWEIEQDHLKWCK